MKKKKEQTPVPTCADCIHEWACQTWTHGTIHNMDATNCAVRETVGDSAAYFIGYMDGQKAQRELIQNMKCFSLDGVTIKPDGMNELDPCRYEVVERYRNVTVEIGRCKKCGHTDITWFRQEDTVDDMEE